jgi:putative oxidoreductase
MKDWADIPLRLGLGIVFIFHGLQKAFGMLGGPGIDGFAKMLSGLGLNPAVPLAYLVAYIELIGGLFLIIGLATKIVSVLLAIIMAVALFTVHITNGFSIMAGGYEYNLVLICACISLFLATPSKFCVTKKI